MSDYFVGSGAARQRISLNPAFARGAAGTIHRVPGKPGLVAKIYVNPAQRSAYARKLEIMLARPPKLPDVPTPKLNCVQIAWPTEAIFDAAGDIVGFLMPEVDFDRSRMLEDVLHKDTRRVDGIAEFYGLRVLLAANLATVIAGLHARGHYMIDMKPENLRFYPDHWYIAVVDTDGFSVKGTRTRIPSEQFSDNYVAPEAKGRKPKDLGQGQDLFALAVIIFRLLNNGIHPYQGVARNGAKLPAELQERIFANLYAYGRRAHPQIKPKPGSIHETFDDETRALFDRAFESGAVRPTAQEWQEHLTSLVKDRLEKCSKDASHAHFGKGCGLCAEDARLAARAKSQQKGPASASQLNVSGLRVQPSTSPRPTTASHAASSPPLPSPSAVPPNASSGSGGGRGSGWMVLAVIAGMAVLGIFLRLLTQTPGSPTSPSPPVQQTISYFSAPADYIATPNGGATYLNVRRGPGTSYASVQQLAPGEIVTALGSTRADDGDPWLLVRTTSGYEGYVKESLLRQAPLAPAPVSETPPPLETIAPVATTHRTSFDCGRARTWTERQVCGTASLAALDVRMAEVYTARIRASSSTEARSLRSSQSRWRRSRDGCERDRSPVQCLSRVYAERIEQLASSRSPAPTTPTPPPEALEQADLGGKVPQPISQRPDIVAEPELQRPPTQENMASVYPDRARRQGLGGQTRMQCSVRATGRLEDCVILEETPPDLGFGRASLRLARYFRFTPRRINGRRVDGGQVTIPLNWQPTDP